MLGWLTLQWEAVLAVFRSLHRIQFTAPWRQEGCRC